MNSLTAPILDLKRFAVHDGDGIRTTVFLAGCPLRCRWCHNPEGFTVRPPLAYRPDKCLSCGLCAAVCPSGGHKMTASGHLFDRDACRLCGSCADECIGDALTFYGKPMSSEELLPLLLEDKSFYESSGGGVTLSGGECLVHPSFCRELALRLADAGVKTAIDTCGAVPYSAFEAVLDTADVFLYDIKAIDSDVHRACTGRGNEEILSNLGRILDAGAKVEIRVPYVPDCNGGEMDAIAEFLAPLPITGCRVLAYHAFAGSKYESLGLSAPDAGRVPDRDEMARIRDRFRAAGVRVIE